MENGKQELEKEALIMTIHNLLSQSELFDKDKLLKIYQYELVKILKQKKEQFLDF